jgi:anaerobic selenocysteine-containing dehydrogenase
MKIVPDAGVQSVLKLMHGESGNIGFDLEKSNYILNFGVNLFETSSSPVWHNRLYGYLNREREGRRAKLVHIDSIANITAYKSDEWIKVNPATAGALALGIANVLVRRGLYNSGYVRSNTFGFEDWTDSKGVSHKGFKNILLDEYDPRTVSKITRVPIRDIERLAYEFAQNSPGIAIFDDNLANLPGGTYSQMAVHSLNALVGNINSAGGVFMQQEIPFSEMPKVKKDPAAAKGLSQQKIDLAQTAQFPFAESIVPNILQDQAKNQIDTLFIHNCNPLYTLHECGKYKELFQSIPFVVNFSSFYDETTQYCDLLLPEPTFLEKWQDVPAGSQTGLNQILGISKPVISPLYNTRHAGDVFLSFALAIGAPLSSAFPWETFENYLKESLKGIFESKSGMIFSGVYDESFMESLERSGWQYSTYTTFDEFLEQIVESGGWWNPFLPQMKSKTSFKTPSGKFEFFSQTLLNRMKETGGSPEDNRLNDELFIPHFETPQYLGNPSEDHLILIPFETGALRDGAVNSQPSLMGVLNPIDSEKWDSWIEINRGTALKFNLSHNDDVRVESPFGSFTTKLKISNRVVPGIVGIPEGLGHTNPNNPDKLVGVNPNSILGSNIDRISGKDAKRGTRVSVYKI